ncbi:MAG: hypothetical protein ACI4QA_04305 [Candidatus Spyradosoma sp.]
MNLPRRKIFFLGLAAAGALLLAGVGTLFWLARREIRAGTFVVSTPRIAPDAATDATRGVPVGAPVEISADAETHFGLDPALRLEFSLPDGLEAAERIDRETSLLGPLRRTRLRFALIPLAPGDFADASFTVEARDGDSGETRRVSVALPTIRAVLPESAPDAPLALVSEFGDGADEAFPRALLALGAAAVLLLGAAVFFVLRRRRLRALLSPEIPPWTRAESELAALRGELDAGRIGSVAAVARLSDIVRRYLARRFGLSADAMTSQEFFVSMEKPDSPFPPEHRGFLREFLNAADLVKFAGLAAGRERTNAAIARAGTLVAETTPPPALPEKNASAPAATPPPRGASRHGKL